MAEVRLCRMTATELLACCEAAHMRAEENPVHSISCSPEWNPPYAFSNPTQITNEELKGIEALFVSFLSDAELWRRLIDIVKHKHPDGAAAALYFLNLPTLVFMAREDTSGLNADKVQGQFPLKTVLKKTTTNEELIRLCRSLLDDPTAHDRVIESAVGLLYGAVLLGRASKDQRGELVLGGRGDEALEQFFLSLSRVVSRPGLTPATVVDSTHLLGAVVAAWDSRLDMGSHAASPPFRAALDRIKRKLGPEIYVHLRALFTPLGDLTELMQVNGQEAYLAERLASAVALARSEQRGGASESLSEQLRADSKATVQAGSINSCAAEGCMQAADSKKCARCKLVSYCSKECQTAHWRVHKRQCTPVGASQQPGAAARAPTAPTASSTAASTASTAAGRALAAQYLEGPSPATLGLRRALAERLSENPGLDFVLTSRSDRDVAVQFEKVEGRAMFRVMKARAESAPSEVSDTDRRKALSFMHMMLADVIAKQGAGISLRQLQAELEALYGAYDPQEPWRGASPVTPEAIKAAMRA